MRGHRYLKNRAGRQAGFTLFELMIAMLLVTMVSVMIYSILNVGIKFSEKGEGKIVSMARKHGLLGLLQRQVQSAVYSEKERKLLIYANGDLFKIVTRSPFIYRGVGVVLAMYRYDEGSQTIYYQEKRDYYNIDYGEDYMPDFADMVVLAENEPSFGLTYDEAMGPEVTLNYRGREEIFIPKSLNAESLAKIEER